MINKGGSICAPCLGVLPSCSWALQEGRLLASIPARKGNYNNEITKNMKNKRFTALAILLAGVLGANADPVLDWNGYWEEAVFATAQPPAAHARFGAILHTAVFDAVNGIAREYTPYYVTELSPPGARAEAAAAQAAYTVLTALYPSQTSVLNEHL